jgi:alpha-ketoglutarate-dependent taurine dioxygenase
MHIKSLSASLGAEVTDLDASALQDPGIAQALRNAVHNHLVLIIRNQKLGLNGQVDLTRLFGEPDMAWDRRSRHRENSHIQVMNSAPRPLSSPRSSSQFWHTDGSFLPNPPLVTLLALQVLPDGGGDTRFIDMRSAYKSLPADLIAEISELKLIFSYRHLLYGFQTSKYGEDREELEDHPDVCHPLVRQHPVTGHGALYMDQLCVAGVEGFPEAESASLLDRLYSHAIVPERCYQHNWSEGDLLIWDNPSLMHRRGTDHHGTRLLYRTTAAGPIPTPMPAAT